MNKALNTEDIGSRGSSITVAVHEGCSSDREGFVRIKEFKVNGDLTPRACEEIARLFQEAADVARLRVEKAGV